MRYLLTTLIIVFCFGTAQASESIYSMEENNSRLYLGFNQVSGNTPWQSTIYKVGLQRQATEVFQYGFNVGFAPSVGNDTNIYCDAFSGCSAQLESLYRVGLMGDVRLAKYFRVSGELGYNVQEGYAHHYQSINNQSLRFNAQYFDVRLAGDIYIPIGQRVNLVFTPLAVKIPVAYTKIDHDPVSTLPGQASEDVKDSIGNGVAPIQLLANAAFQWKF